MKILLDTNILLWALTDDVRLSHKGKAIIGNEKNTIYISLASIWEIQIKHSLYPSVMPDPKLVLDCCKKAGYNILSIESSEILNISTLTYATKPMHKDPFDRILLSTAKTYGFSFLTADNLLQNYNEDCVLCF